MSQVKESKLDVPRENIRGTLARDGVRIAQKDKADELSSRGYGSLENGKLVLTFFEALYLVDKGFLEVQAKGKTIDFRCLLQVYQKSERNAWARYLAYRDLRSRGYVVREGFGEGIDFRVYDRGDYSKDAAKYLTLNVQEGKPLPVADLAFALTQSRSLKKELVLAVVNRRGELVYYSVSQMSLPQQEIE